MPGFFCICSQYVILSPGTESGINSAKTTQKASVAKMSLLIFITEPKSWGFSPIQ